MKALLLCAGKGTRLYPLTQTIPKAMVLVNGKPMIDYLLEQIEATGIREIGIVVSPFSKPHFEAYLKNGEDRDLSITYIEQTEPKGIAHAIYQAKVYIGDEPFFVSLGDNMTSSSLYPLIDAFSVDHPHAVLGVVKVSDPTRFGIVQTNKDGLIQSIVEKPKHDVGNLAAAGFYVFHPDIFRVIETLSPSNRGEYEVTDAIQRLVEQGLTCIAVPIKGWWKDVGTHDDLKQANHYTEKRRHIS